MEPNQPYIPSQMNPAEDQTIGQTPSVGPITYPNPPIRTPSIRVLKSILQARYTAALPVVWRPSPPMPPNGGEWAPSFPL